MVDENLPFTRFQLNNLLGYVMNDETYRDYWIHNPSAALYEDMYQLFLTGACTQRSLVEPAEQLRREHMAGYDRDHDAPRSFVNMTHEQRVSSLQRLQAPVSNSIFSSSAAARSNDTVDSSIFSFGSSK